MGTLWLQPAYLRRRSSPSEACLFGFLPEEVCLLDVDLMVFSAGLLSLTLHSADQLFIQAEKKGVPILHWNDALTFKNGCHQEREY